MRQWPRAAPAHAGALPLGEAGAPDSAGAEHLVLGRQQVHGVGGASGAGGGSAAPEHRHGLGGSGSGRQQKGSGSRVQRSLHPGGVRRSREPYVASWDPHPPLCGGLASLSDALACQFARHDRDVGRRAGPRHQRAEGYPRLAHATAAASVSLPDERRPTGLQLAGVYHRAVPSCWAGLPGLRPGNVHPERGMPQQLVAQHGHGTGGGGAQ
mmetsp:Transcript_19050/g.72037  ORF Transcript_19050/g.72037 Transcript_19050/m.72037 type:complete len:211 (+) Transcript_19050:715-1347(+)